MEVRRKFLMTLKKVETDETKRMLRGGWKNLEEIG